MASIKPTSPSVLPSLKPVVSSSVFILPEKPAQAPSSPDSSAKPSAQTLPLSLIYRQANVISLQWLPNGSGNSYEISVNGVALKALTKATNYVLTDLKPETLYRIEVKSFDQQAFPVSTGKLEIWTLASRGSSSSAASNEKPTLVNLPKRWTVEPEGQMLFNQTPALGPDGSVYFGLFPSTLYAYDQLGNFRWQASLDATPRTSPIVDSQGNVYMGVFPGAVVAHDSEGNFKWRLEMEDDDPISLTLSPDQQILIAVGRQGTVFAWSLQDLSLLWTNVVSTRLATQTAIGHNQLYVGGSDGIWHALDVETGGVLWQFYGDGAQTDSYPLVDSFRVYFPQQKGLIYALDPSGYQHWVYQAKSKLLGAPVQDPDGNILFLTDDHFINSISNTGRLNWRQSLERESSQSSPVIDEQGYIYVATERNLKVFDSSGQLRSNRLLEEDINGDLTIGPTGLVYVLGVSGRLRTYQSLGGALASQGWPKAHRTTGNQGY